MDLEYQFYILRQKVKVAREAKERGWPDLFSYSLRTAEELVVEIEEVLNAISSPPHDLLAWSEIDLIGFC